MSMSVARRTALVLAIVLAGAGCATTRQAQAPRPAEPSPPPAAQGLPRPGVRDGDVFESPEFVVTIAKAGDTPDSLAARHLDCIDDEVTACQHLTSVR